MRALTILYDTHCGLCRKVREWLEAEPAYLGLEFLPAGSAEVSRRFPGLEPERTLRELTVVSDEGWVYQGEAAYLMCLYALKGYREWAIACAGPLGRVLFRLAVFVLKRLRWRAACDGSCQVGTYRVPPAPGRAS